jgi:hypothetical protein
VDGSQHGESQGAARDRHRTAWLESQGYRLLRFWNNDVAQNIGEVMEAVYAALYGSRYAVPRVLKHKRHRRHENSDSVTPPRRLRRRPSPCRGG